MTGTKEALEESVPGHTEIKAVVGTISLICASLFLASFIYEVLIYHSSYPVSNFNAIFVIILLPALVITIVKIMMIEPATVHWALQVLSLSILWIFLITYFFALPLIAPSYNPQVTLPPDDFQLVFFALIVAVTFWFLEVASSSTSILIKRYWK